MSPEIERRPVVGYEGIYEVSSDGEVFRVGGGMGAVAGRKLNPILGSHGYLYVHLYRDGVQKTHKVHRIVAKAFHHNPDNLPIVNHINGIRTDNRAENLEWCDKSHDVLHAYRVLGRKPSYGRKGKPRPEGAGSPKRPVRGTNITTGEVVDIESTHAAARFVNGSQGNIGKTCQGKYKHAYGWRWEYI
jgi:hypothetical protein